MVGTGNPQGRHKPLPNLLFSFEMDLLSPHYLVFKPAVGHKATNLSDSGILSCSPIG